MKKNLPLLFAALFAVLANFSVKAQTTDAAVMALDVTIDGVTTTLKKGVDCGFETANAWGGPVLTGGCWEAAWARTAASDSLNCDSTVNDLTGKIALIRRGVCEFGLKCLNAEDAGASAAIVFNHYTDGTQNNCTVIPMGAGVNGPAVTIPCFFLSRESSEIIGAAVNAGKTVTICARLLSLYDPTAEISYATPVSQADSLNLITVNVVNRTGVEQEFVAKAEITDPNGVVTVLTSTQMMGVDGDSLFGFDLYKPSAGVGTYRIVYSADKAVAAGDSVFREFVLTPSTFRSDNLTLRSGGVAPTATNWADAGYKYQSAGMVKTGPAGMEAVSATIGIGNPAAVATGDPAADIVNVLLYDADFDDDGSNNIDGDFSSLLDGFIAFVDINFDATTKPDSFLTADLISLLGDKVELKPSHLYYISVLYDGNAANSAGGDTTAMGFTFSNQVYYGQWTLGDGTVIGLQTPLMLDQLYSGWSGATVFTALNEVGYVPSSVKQDVLSSAKFTVTPNPTPDQVNLNLELAKQNATVAVTLMDYAGRPVKTEVVKNFQNGRISMDASTLPSGQYLLWIRTSEEGSTMAKLMICH